MKVFHNGKMKCNECGKWMKYIDKYQFKYWQCKCGQAYDGDVYKPKKNKLIYSEGENDANLPG